MTPQAGLTREEQVNLMGSLLSDRSDASEGSEEPLPVQVDILYHQWQILSEVFGKLKNELRLARLRILCTHRGACLHISCSRTASDSSDMVRH
jgi:hypothetical protein